MTAAFTPRRHSDGTIRIDITVTYSLRATDLAQILASAHRTTCSDALPLLRYTDAVKTVRGELRARGGDAPLLWRADSGKDEREANALALWAYSEITRLFPALTPA
ncbi:hypothetical protein ACIG3E_32745 [Streptomyces sp. NPDC053474]|uniref:hypothetical protein n=1 Tax=Streptomyces sp. NPDC053474 TaxID=3365704 RepID=UPI0037D1863C